MDDELTQGFTVRLPKPMYERVKKMAQAETRTMNLQVQHLIKIALDTLDSQKKKNK